MSEIVKIDLNKMKLLAQEGESFIFRAEAEQSLLELHRTIEMLQALEEQVKEAIGKAGKEINPNFKGVIGENVKCLFRKYGKKYAYDWKNKEACMPYLIKKEYYNVDADLVDKYVKEVGELPEGIEENDREETLSIIYNEPEEVRLLDEEN